MFATIGKNKFKTKIIVAGVFTFLIAVVFFIAYFFDFGMFAVPFAVAIAFLSSFFSYYYSDKIVLKISGARPADPETERRIASAMEGLVIASGMPMPRVYIITDSSPNAFATGRNPKNAVVAVTTGLLERLDYYELEGVLAHELAHIKNYDILLSTVVTVMIGIVVILADMTTRMLFWGGSSRGRSGKKSDSGNGSAQLVMFAVGLVFLILAPIAGQLMKLALSRNREYLADATAVEFTRNPDGLASALAKLDQSIVDVDKASKATAQMYIVNPLKNKNKKKASSLFSTHPPIPQRIEAIRNIK